MPGLIQILKGKPNQMNEIAAAKWRIGRYQYTLHEWYSHRVQRSANSVDDSHRSDSMWTCRFWDWQTPPYSLCPQAPCFDFQRHCSPHLNEFLALPLPLHPHSWSETEWNWVNDILRHGNPFHSRIHDLAKHSRNSAVFPRRTHPLWPQHSTRVYHHQQLTGLYIPMR